MRFVQALGVAIVLATVAAPAVAQTDTDLCLRVQVATDVDLADATAVQDGIGSGDIVVTGVVPCDGVLASEAPASDVGTGAWTVLPIEVDPMTDERRALAYLASESGTTSQGHPIQLSIACADGSTELTVGWGWNLGSESLIDVETRIGDGEITTERWFIAGEATTYGGSDTAFVESLFGETRLALRLQTADYGLSAAAFDITGMENAVATVREACGW
jgi:hypothetical protein